MADLTDPATGHVPFTVTAELAGGIAIGAGWGIALDGLLAAELWAEQKANLRASGQSTQRLVDVDCPVDLDLPLSRCGPIDGLWHWAATCALPSSLTAGHEREVRYWTGRMDMRIYRQTTATMPATVPTHHGRWRNRIMPVIVTNCRSVTWQGVGDIAVVARLLSSVDAIGKKRSQGEGHVLSWRVEPAGNRDRWAFGHLHTDGTLGRPVPENCLSARPVPHGGLGAAGLRPPYLHPSRRHELLLPAPLV